MLLPAFCEKIHLFHHHMEREVRYQPLPHTGAKITLPKAFCLCINKKYSIIFEPYIFVVILKQLGVGFLHQIRNIYHSQLFHNYFLLKYKHSS